MNSATPAKPVHEVITDAMTRVLIAADQLTNEYTRTDSGYGTLPGALAAEEELIQAVQAWRAACGSRSKRGPTALPAQVPVQEPTYHVASYIWPDEVEIKHDGRLLTANLPQHALGCHMTETILAERGYEVTTVVSVDGVIWRRKDGKATPGAFGNLNAAQAVERFQSQQWRWWR